MEISFNIQDFGDIDDLLSREWIDTDCCGNYASSTILGVNTRNHHGLFVLDRKQVESHLVILSSIHEEFHGAKENFPLYSVEYATDSLYHSKKFQTKFSLDPVPTFVYRCNQVEIQKSLCLVENENRLIIRYLISGEIEPRSRLIVRPFFAFRPGKMVSNPKWFINTEVFLLDQQFRFLPYAEAPEIFMSFSKGAFISAPMWYNNFFYRHQSSAGLKKEDLLNPGFFETPVEAQSEIYISIGLSETNTAEVREFYQNELERRLRFGGNLESASSRTRFFFSKLDIFRKRYNSDLFYWLPQLPGRGFNLNHTSFVSRNLLKGQVDKENAEKYYRNLIQVLTSEDALILFRNEHPYISSDWETPFRVVLFLYKYHNAYPDREALNQSLEIIEKIIQLVQKNRLPFFRLNSKKGLEAESPIKEGQKGSSDYRLLPGSLNFLLNVFWFNTLKMASQLMSFADQRNTKFEKPAEKAFENARKNYNSMFKNIDGQITIDESAELHPTMIYSLSLPFGFFTRDQSRALYQELVRRYLTVAGVKFPIGTDAEENMLISPLLTGEFLDVWQMLMSDNQRFCQIFLKMLENWSLYTRTGKVGFLPLILNLKNPGEANLSSSLVASEAFYVSRCMDKLRSKYPEPAPEVGL